MEVIMTKLTDEAKNAIAEIRPSLVGVRHLSRCLSANGLPHLGERHYPRLR
jgi:hypothetical protein